MDFIKALELNIGKEAKKDYLPMQPGDVPQTWADVSDLNKLGYKNNTTRMKKGTNIFVDWFKNYYKNN